MTKKQRTQKIQSLLVGFSIIDFVARSKKPVKFNDIHYATKITKSNLYKYLNTLTSLDVLYRDEETGLYSGGTTLIEYGMTIINNDNILEKVTPYLEKVNILSGATTLLTTWSYKGPVIVKMIDSREGLNLGGQVGTVLPIESAGGKLYATFKEGPLIEQWIESETKDISPTEYASLEKEFQSIKQNWIAFAHGALAPSIQSTAVPFFNYNNKIIGAFVIVGFENTIPKSLNDTLSDQLLNISYEVSNIFGYENINKTNIDLL